MALRPARIVAGLLGVAGLLAGCSPGVGTPDRSTSGAWNPPAAGTGTSPGAAPSIPPSTAPSTLPSLTPSGAYWNEMAGAGHRLVESLIPYGPERREQMAQYGVRRYGSRLTTLEPRAIVLHFTEGDTAESTIAHFSRNVPADGEYPQVCAHYVIDQRGTVHLLVPPTTPCRHAIGMNHVALGIEFVQNSRGRGSAWADRQILGRPAQVEAGLALVRDLQARFGIPTNAVLGHAETGDSPLFEDRTGRRNDHTDWLAADAAEFRRRL